jgi:cholesterol oxidase
MNEGQPAHPAERPVRRGEQFVEDGAHYDVVIVGSGFGGSVSALRLVDKGYKVLVLEKGRRFGATDFARTNWNLRRWMWLPQLGLRGIFKMTFFRHMTVFSGVGVGGGSLTYANTLPVPKDEFFESPSWRGLADWKPELTPHYQTAQRMLGATKNPQETEPDRILKAIAADIGRADHFESNDVAVYFGTPQVKVPDPFFAGRGPERTGCHFCGACMTGCRHGAKNTLDKNYLYLAEAAGVLVQPDTLVTAVRPRPEGGYRLEARLSRGWGLGRRLRLSADRVIFSGGVLGTVELLLKMKDDPKGLPNLSARLGDGVRTNSESLIGVATPNREFDLSEGIAITSILHTDEHSHVEPVRYGRGSGFFRLLMGPHAPAGNVLARLAGATKWFFKRPGRFLRVIFVRDWAKQSSILLYMQTIEGTLRMVLRRSWMRPWRRILKTVLSHGEPPAAYIAKATEIAERYADKVGGVTVSLISEAIIGTPSTAHILGGACMGATAEDGVIDAEHRVHGYDGLYVVDGAAVSANPGVNPSLTITALAERAMARIPAKAAATEAGAEEAPALAPVGAATAGAGAA